MFHFSRERALQAARNWQGSEAERQKAARAKADGRFDKVDTPERIAKHANRLREQVLGNYRTPHRETEVGGQTALPESIRELASKPVTKADVGPRLLERVIDTKDFLSAEFFELGSAATRPVARIETRMDGNYYYGTGFLVSPTLLLTNEHVLEQAGWAVLSVAEFDYQRDRFGNPRQARRFSLDPETFFLNDKFLDYALVAVSPTPVAGSGNVADYGFCPLIAAEGKILVTDPVNVIQHPLGRLKEVVIRENRLSALPSQDGFNHIAHYLADTEQGSSGSPVFNDRWEVIALHHQAVPSLDARGNNLTKDGRV
jgi:endonuclease G